MRTVIFAALFLFLGGCSSVELIYNQADRLMRWQADSYLDLNDEQMAWLRPRVADLHQWHRRTQLPRYAALLRDSAQQIVERPPTIAEVDQLRDEVEAMADDSLIAFALISAELLTQVDAEQIQYLQARFSEENDDRAEEFAELSDEQWRQETRERLADSYDEFLGDLSDEQHKVIEAAVAELKRDSDAWLEYRRQWQQSFFALLDQRQSSTCFLNDFVTLSVEREAMYSDVYRALRERNEKIYRDLGIAMLALASEQQRQHVAGEMRDWADRLDRLAREELDDVETAYEPRLPNSCSDSAVPT